MGLLLTGPPGIGKTTVLREAARKLTGFHVVGFYTEEIRVGRERRGFRIRAFTGEDAIIAHVNLPPPRVSKYGVDVAMIDRFAATLTDPGNGATIYLIDEIGKMECLSSVFVDAVTQLMDDGALFVATVAQRGGGLIEAVKRRGDVETWTVTTKTRDILASRIVAWIHGAIGKS
jgi:nucleoside-triphosphatase